MANIVLVCDIFLKRGSSFFDFLYHLPTHSPHQYILLVRGIDKELSSRLTSLGYEVKIFHSSIDLAKYFLRYQPNLIHFHFYGIGHRHILLAKCLAPKVLLTFHNSLLKKPKINFYLRVKQSLLALPLSRVIAVSSFTSSWLCSLLPPIKVVHIDNGIDLTRFRPIPQIEVTQYLECCYIGSLSNEKGVNKLISLFSLPEIARFARLHLVGEGELQEVIHRLPEQTDNIISYGYLNDVTVVLKKVHLVLVPSDWYEAFGYSAVEAMATQRPIIAQPVGALKDLFSNDLHGWHADYNNMISVQKLLERIHRSPLLLKRTGEQAQAWVKQKYDIHNQIKKTHRQYCQLLNE
ncbi:TPA: glycosyltransferase family 4 protein [Photobacterium damselae]